ncbi:ser thr protein phosphatase superfamily [Parachaetomium inaequale]|uniref:Ser thr protein phosphatase superfamily n=1 Tax=Parachaetomium inaequale TaxID=2588326 RepID=A0AAN6PLL2_9PEZI|nr:ser thr protein phosphatase superfamily [Parachaetomium inaequale]
MEALFNKVRQRLGPRPRVQILSDLHLEVGQQYSTFTFPATAPFLLLAGDIGRLIDYTAYCGFLESQVARYKQVFLVLGNHEFYGLDYESGLAEARRLAQEPSLRNGLMLLNCARWDDPDSDLIILGCTLWSAIPQDAYGVVEAKVNDFKKINQWTAKQHNTIHLKELSWIRENVRLITAAPGKKRLLIATHHAPCIEGTSRPEHVSNPWTPAFATDLVDQHGWEVTMLHQRLNDAAIALHRVLDHENINIGIFGGYAVTAIGGVRESKDVECLASVSKDQIIQILNGKEGFAVIPQSRTDYVTFLWSNNPGRQNAVLVEMFCERFPGAQFSMAGVPCNTVAIQGLTLGQGTSRFLDPFYIFKGKLRAAATPSKFTDSADLRMLVSRHEAIIRPRVGELSIEYLGHAVKRYIELGILFERLGIDVEAAKEAVKDVDQLPPPAPGDVQQGLLA